MLLCYTAELTDTCPRLVSWLGVPIPYWATCPSGVGSMSLSGFIRETLLDRGARGRPWRYSHSHRRKVFRAARRSAHTLPLGLHRRAGASVLRKSPQLLLDGPSDPQGSNSPMGDPVPLKGTAHSHLYPNGLSSCPQLDYSTFAVWCNVQPLRFRPLS